MANGDRSQQATPRRKQEARKRGQIARSRELTGALSGLAVVVLLGWQLPSVAAAWKSLFLQVTNHAGASDSKMMHETVTAVGGALLHWMAAPFALAWSVAVLSSLAQGGLVLSTEPLLPSWQRLNPLTNLQLAFSLSAVNRTLKSLVPVAAILFIAFAMARRDWIVLATSSRGGVSGLLVWMGGRLYQVAWTCSLVLLVWSVVDYTLLRYQLSQSLKMTKQEVLQESKDTEGNPFTRNRIRKRQREARKRWTMKDVERATAIVANPQHMAIALEYRPQTMAAPVVVAKGVDEVALRIKDVGRWNNIPIVENPPLAHALYRAAEVGEAIPAKLYAAVAEILAFIYRTQASLRQSAQATPNRPSISTGRE
jgi:flagellar biosynthesis protein FlhB